MPPLGKFAVVVALVGTAVAACAPTSERPSPSTVQSTVPSQLPSASPSPLGHITQQLSVRAENVSALQVSPGLLWIGLSGSPYGSAGRLLRFDATSGRQTGSWTAGGEPIAIAVAGNYVWIANGFGDASRPLPEQNTVTQLNVKTGVVVHVYPVTDPRGIAAIGDTALVVSSRTQNGPTEVHRLQAGESAAVSVVPGNLQGPSASSERALAVCGKSIYLAISDVSAAGTTMVRLEEMSSAGGIARTIATLPGAFNVALSCDSSALFVVEVGPNGGIVRANLSDGAVAGPWGDGYPLDAVFASGNVWVLHASQHRSAPPYLTAIGSVSGVQSQDQLTLPLGSAYLLTSDGSDLWVVDGSVVVHVAPK